MGAVGAYWGPRHADGTVVVSVPVLVTSLGPGKMVKVVVTVATYLTRGLVTVVVHRVRVVVEVVVAVVVGGGNSEEHTLDRIDGTTPATAAGVAMALRCAATGVGSRFFIFGPGTKTVVE